MKCAGKSKEWKWEKGRLEKKIGDQKRELEKLSRKLEETRRGAFQTQVAVDALLTAVTLEYGTDTEELGKRLTLAAFDLEKLRRDYEIQASREDGGYVLTVRERGTADGKCGKKAEV